MSFFILINNLDIIFIKYKTDYEVTSTIQMIFVTGFIIFYMIGIIYININIEENLLTYISENIY